MGLRLAPLSRLRKSIVALPPLLNLRSPSRAIVAPVLPIAALQPRSFAPETTRRYSTLTNISSAAATPEAAGTNASITPLPSNPPSLLTPQQPTLLDNPQVPTSVMTPPTSEEPNSAYSPMGLSAAGRHKPPTTLDPFASNPPRHQKASVVPTPMPLPPPVVIPTAAATAAERGGIFGRIPLSAAMGTIERKLQAPPSQHSYSSASLEGEQHSAELQMHATLSPPSPDSAGRPDLAEPEHVVTAAAAELPALFPASHWITDLRGRSFEDRGMVVRYQAGTFTAEKGESEGPASRAPSESWTEMTFPFASCRKLQDSYRLGPPGEGADRMRMGLLLEDLDCFAADVAGRHISQQGVAQITAAGEEVRWFHPSAATTSAKPTSGLIVTVLRDLRVVGQVTWVGRSSLEVCVDLRTREKNTSQWTPAGCGRFMIVARDIATQKSIQVPALAPESHAELEKHRQGAERQAQRTAARDSGSDGGGEDAAVAEASSPDAELVSLRRMHWQDRNTQGRVFGGHLINEAYELAEAAAELRVGAGLAFRAMTGFKFVHSPSIPGVVRFTARIADCTESGGESGFAVVLVKAEEQTSDGQPRVLTSEASFAFDALTA